MPRDPDRCPRCGLDVPGEARFCPACGFARARLSPGETLDGKYEILDKIGEGGMGEVFRARHVHLEEIRIIKVTKPDPAGEGAEPRRFLEEARMATRVRHPNVASLYDFSRLPDGAFYMVWEFIDGTTLEEWMRDRGPFPAARAVEIARQVLSGLAEIHAQGIVHRDLSPDNIMIREGLDGRLQAKIIDLGIAKRMAAESLQMTGTGMFLGKVKYCSPEQAGALPRGETVDARSDLYSFGAVLYEMVAGHPPFEAETPEGYIGQHLHATAPPLDVGRLPPRLGPALAAIVSRALQKSRSRRFASAEDFRDALERIPPAPAGWSEAVPMEVLEVRRAAPRVWLFVALLVVVAAVVAYAMVHRSRPSPQRPPQGAEAPAGPSAIPSPDVPEVEAPTPGAVERLPAGTRGSRRTVEDPSEPGAAAPVAPLSPSPRRPEPTERPG